MMDIYIYEPYNIIRNMKTPGSLLPRIGLKRHVEHSNSTLERRAPKY